MIRPNANAEDWLNLPDSSDILAKYGSQISGTVPLPEIVIRHSLPERSIRGLEIPPFLLIFEAATVSQVHHIIDTREHIRSLVSGYDHNYIEGGKFKNQRGWLAGYPFANGWKRL